MSDRDELRAYYQAVLDTRLSAIAWAKRAGKAPSNISRFLREADASMPKPDTLRSFVATAPRSVTVPPAVRRMMGDTTEPLERPGTVDIGGTDYIAVGWYDAALSAGPGSLLDTAPNPLGFHIFEARWLRQATAAPPGKLAVLGVTGDSMHPTLHDGDAVLLDRTKKRPSTDGIYALRIGDDLSVKRLTPDLAARKILVLSDNPLYPPQTLDPDDLQVIGKVIWLVARRL